jgi:hypothetical protein
MLLSSASTLAIALAIAGCDALTASRVGLSRIGRMGRAGFVGGFAGVSVCSPGVATAGGSSGASGVMVLVGEATRVSPKFGDTGEVTGG